MDNTFYQLSLVLLLASGIGVIMYKLKLPLVVSYLLAGLLLSVYPDRGISQRLGSLAGHPLAGLGQPPLPSPGAADVVAELSRRR